MIYLSLSGIIDLVSRPSKQHITLLVAPLLQHSRSCCHPQNQVRKSKMHVEIFDPLYKIYCWQRKQKGEKQKGSASPCALWWTIWATLKKSSWFLSLILSPLVSPLSFLALSFCHPITLRTSCPLTLGVSQPIPSHSWVFWGYAADAGSCLWVSQWTAGCCDGWTCWAAHYCCDWSPLLVIIPACHQSWHPLHTSQGGWKLNRGSLPCLWPKEPCVCVQVQEHFYIGSGRCMWMGLD